MCLLPTGALAQTSVPAQVLATYFEAYDWGPMRITDVSLEFNVIYLFHATPDGTDGTFAFLEGEYPSLRNPTPRPGTGNPNVAVPLVKEVRARGQRVILTVGGAGAGFSFSTRSQSDKFIASYKRMFTYFGGLDGVDFNNFEAGIGSSSTEMVYIAQTLKAFYGSNFLITAPPSGATDYGWIDTNIGRALNKAGLLSWFGPQIYDDPNRYSSAERIAFEVNRWISKAPEGYVATGQNNQYGIGDASKIVIGMPASWLESSQGYPLSRATAAYDMVKAKHPTLRGVFSWNAKSNYFGGNKFGMAFAQRLPGATLIGRAPASEPAPAPAPALQPAPVASCLFPNWVIHKSYAAGDIVKYTDGKFYRAKYANPGYNPTISTYYWAPYSCTETAPAPAPQPAPVASCIFPNWVLYKSYAAGEIVKYTDGKFYRAKYANPGYNPTISTYYWAPYSCSGTAL